MSKSRYIYLVAFIATSLLPAVAHSEAMLPLQENIESGAEQTYPLVRCAGLYLSNLEWAGDEQLGLETATKTKLTISNLIELAIKLRSPNLGESAEESVYRDIRNISDIYLIRYEANYATTGEAWGSDAMWESDISICRTLLGE